MNYPLSHKQVLIVKKSISYFNIYLKPIKFLVRTNLKIISGMIKENRELADNNVHIM